MFTDAWASAEFDGIDPSNTAGDDETAFKDRSTSVLSTDSSDSNATATIVFQMDAADAANFAQADAELEPDEVEAGTTVDVVIKTDEGTQTEESFIIEGPLEPQLSDRD